MQTSTSDSNLGIIHAELLDGQSAESINVELEITQNGCLQIFRAGTLLNSFQPSEIQYQPPIGKSALFIGLPSGASLQIPYNPAVAAKLASYLHPKQRWLIRAESKLRWVFILIVASILLLFAAYRWGLPAAVSIAQPLIPMKAKQFAGSQIMGFLEKYLLVPSAQSQSSSDSVSASMEHLASLADLPLPPRFLFRNIKSACKDKTENCVEGANALALLPDMIIITDPLLKLISPEEVRAIVAHELGHLAHDDGTQKILRQSFISALTLLLLGTNEGVIGSVATGLLETRYSQEQESAADAYAVEILRKAGYDPLDLARGLEKLTRDHESEAGFEQYFSTHPETAARVRAITQMAQQKPAPGH